MSQYSKWSKAKALTRSSDVAPEADGSHGERRKARAAVTSTLRSVRRPPGGAAWRPSRGLGAERGPRPVGPVSHGGDRGEDTGGRRDHSVLEFILETVLKDRVRFGKKEMLF